MIDELLAVELVGRQERVEIARQAFGRFVAGLRVSLRRTLENIANALRIEIRKTFERELPTPSEAPADELLGPLLTQACASLKASMTTGIS